MRSPIYKKNVIQEHYINDDVVDDIIDVLDSNFIGPTGPQGFTGPQGPTGLVGELEGLSSESNQLTISKHIIPDTNATCDLGNAEHKIRHLYLSDNSLYIGDNRISNDPETNSIKVSNLIVENELTLNNKSLSSLLNSGTKLSNYGNFRYDPDGQDHPVLRINPETGEIHY